jgi:hypothetical protein
MKLEFKPYRPSKPTGNRARSAPCKGDAKASQSVAVADRKDGQPTMADVMAASLEMLQNTPTLSLQQLVAKLEHKNKLNAERQRRYRAKKAGK